jgi:hypothetical protein
MVSNINLEKDDVHFQEGDKVVVYQEPGTEVVMEVSRRTWKFDKDRRNPILHIELTIASHFVNISNFEKFLAERGFPRS